MNAKRLFASCFGLGRLPLAPGTWGSLPVAAIFTALLWAAAGRVTTVIVMALLAAAGAAVCIRFGSASIEATGKDDPGEIVADEIAGQSVTFFIAGLAAWGAMAQAGVLASAFLGFFFFRLFDTLKPFPAGKLEKLPGVWGVLADDLAAGVYAGITTAVFLKLWMYYSAGPG
jgi:phosphatidylglycerophosphatase A